MAEFNSVTIQDRVEETAAITRLSIPVADVELVRSFQVPGQYVQMRAPGAEVGYFAIASAPEEPTFQFLLKASGAAADAILAVPTGGLVEMSGAAGKGYRVEDWTDHDLILAAVGSGIAPIRALIQHVIQRRARWGRVQLFYGCQRPEDFACRAEIEAWSAAGVDVQLHVSQGDAPDGYSSGYVQEGLGKTTIAPERTVAFVCGMKDMVAGVGAALAELGLAKDRVLQNF